MRCLQKQSVLLTSVVNVKLFIYSLIYLFNYFTLQTIILVILKTFFDFLVKSFSIDKIDKKNRWKSLDKKFVHKLTNLDVVVFYDVTKQFHATLTNRFVQVDEKTAYIELCSSQESYNLYES